MASNLSPSIIIVIAVVAFVAVMITGTIGIIGISRLRRKRNSALLVASRDHRLSGYPGSTRSIRESERTRIPHVSYPLRQPSCRKPTHLVGGWSPIRSCDSLARPTRVLRASNSKASIKVENAAPITTTNGLAWPLPRRLTRSKNQFSGSAEVLSLCPIVEPAGNNNNSTPPTTLTSVVAQSQERNKSSEGNISIEGHSAHSLRPPPLFHDQQRSISAGAINNFSQNSVQPSLITSKARSQTENVPLKSILKRTISLHNQDPGEVPANPMPTPPRGMSAMPRWSMVQALRSLHQDSPLRSSVGSSTSVNSSIIAEEFSRKETELSSTGILLSRDKRSPILYDEAGSFWESPMMRSRSMAPMSPGPSTMASVRSQVVSQKSFRASVEQHSLVRSASSGLSISMVDQFGPSRSVSNASRLDVLAQSRHISPNRAGVAVPKLLFTDTNTRKTSSAADLAHSMVGSSSLNDLGQRGIRSSTSILQVTSGNEGLPNPQQQKKRPSSIATSQPFRWDAHEPMRPGKPSTMKDRVEGHKRQSCQRIVFIPPVIMPCSPGSTVVEVDENEETKKYVSNLPGLIVTKHPDVMASPRPPSCATFEPQVTFSTPNKSPQKEDAHYSATMSMYNIYNLNRNDSSDSILSTPTRKPAPRPRHPNRTTVIIEPSDNPSWPLPTTLLPTSNLLPGLLPPSAHGNPTAPSSPEKTCSTLLSQFQTPPKAPPNWRHHPPRTVKGPRAAPSRLRASRRSPTRSPLRHTVRNSPRNSPKDLRAHVIELRRMNSEASAFDGQERKHYLNMGGSSPMLGLGEDVIVDEDLQAERDAIEDAFEPLKTLGGRKSKDEDLGVVGREFMERARRESDLGVEGVNLGTLGSGEWEWCQAKNGNALVGSSF